MKYLFLLPLLFFAKLAAAQPTCELKMYMITYDSLEATSDTVVIEVAQTSKKFAINLHESDLDERLVVDSVAKKILELSSDDEGKYAYLNEAGSDYDYGYTSVFDLSDVEIIDEESYRFLSEKKTIQGWECQKIELVDGDLVFGWGWVALGLHLGYKEDSGLFRTPKGSVVEFVIPDDEEGGSLTLKLVKLSKTIANPAKAFSLEVPVGYELVESDEE